ncbi:MAG: carboxypeptidase regulatory-like domain-containing protein, partial [Methermicoccaceae archaeon]
VYLRVESNATTLFNDTITVPANCTVVDTSNVSHYIDHPTALGALVEAAKQANFTYNITSSAYGMYVNDINGDTWVWYRINYTDPGVGADQYNLTGDENVLFATGQYYPFYPLYLVAPPYVPSGKPFQVGVVYYNDSLHDWDILDGATVLVNDTSAGTTDEHGLLNLTLSDGTYQLRAEKVGYIRSDRMNVSVAGTLPLGPPPDLAAFLMLPPSTAQGAPMSVGVFVSNEGNGTADTSTLKVFANGTAINETTVPVLAPHAWHYLEFNYTPSSVGLLNITAIADYYEVLSDSNRSNNTAMQYVNVYSNLPLMADTFGVDSSTGQPSTSVVVPLNITNVRDGPIQTITFSMDYNESVIQLQSIQKGPVISSWGLVSLGGDKHSIALSTFSQTDAIANGTSGTVLYLNFSVVGSQGDSTLMSPTSIDFANTDNEHGTAIPTTGTFLVITQSTVRGQVTQSHGGAPVQGANVTLNSDPMATTTDASGNYEFTDVSLGTHQLTFTKEHFYTETAPVNVVSGVNVVNMQLRLRGDIDNNGVQADAVDLNMMVQAVVHDLQSDKYFDLDQNGNEADAVDLNMMVQAVVHDIVL